MKVQTNFLQNNLAENSFQNIFAEMYIVCINKTRWGTSLNIQASSLNFQAWMSIISSKIISIPKQFRSYSLAFHPFLMIEMIEVTIRERSANGKFALTFPNFFIQMCFRFIVRSAKLHLVVH